MSFSEFINMEMLISVAEYTLGMTPGSLAALVLGGLLVAVHGAERFAEPSYGPNDQDPASRIKPRHLALGRQYGHALLAYVSSMLGLYLLLSLSAPLFFPTDPDKSPLMGYSPPVFAAFAIIGVLPNVPWLNSLERAFRGFFHRRAYIPEGARETAAEIAGATMDFSSYRSPDVNCDEVFKSCGLLEDETQMSLLERLWAKGCCIMYRLKRFDLHKKGNEHFDAAFFRLYHGDFEALKREHGYLRGQMEEWRVSQGQDKDNKAKTLESDISAFLDRLYVFLACAVRLGKAHKTQVRQSMAQLGLIMPPAPVKTPLWPPLVQALPAVAIISIVCALFGELVFSGDYPNKELLPGGKKALLWGLASMCLHGLAAYLAWAIRYRMKRNGIWTRNIWASYSLAGICGGGGACAAIVALVAATGSGARAVQVLPWCLPFMVTAFFTAMYFDGYGLEWKTSIKEGAVQGAATGAACVLAALLVALMPGYSAWPGQLVLKYVAFMSLTGALVGFGLGLILPRAWRRTKANMNISPLGHMRVQAKEVAAKALGDPIKANAWLNTPNPDFGGAAPLDLAHTTQGLNRIRQAVTKA